MVGKVRINIENFGGEIPRRSEFLLPDSFASATGDVDLLSGELRSLHATRELYGFQVHTEKAFLIEDPRYVGPIRVIENGIDTRRLEHTPKLRTIEGSDAKWIASSVTITGDM